eukprot:jgi/Mesvir1/19260/Mv10341-RA.1
MAAVHVVGMSCPKAIAAEKFSPVPRPNLHQRSRDGSSLLLSEQSRYRGAPRHSQRFIGRSSRNSSCRLESNALEGGGVSAPRASELARDVLTAKDADGAAVLNGFRAADHPKTEGKPSISSSVRGDADGCAQLNGAASTGGKELIGINGSKSVITPFEGFTLARKSLNCHDQRKSPRSRWPRAPKTRKTGDCVLRVGVDVDEVLGRFLYSLNEYCKETYNWNYSLSDYKVYDFKTVWKVNQEEANHYVHEFFKSNHFAQGIPPIPGAKSSLERLSTLCDLVVVTSRQHVIREPTLQWLDAHFPDIFSSVHFGNHYALHGQSRSKSQICKELAVDVLIDDNPAYAEECAAAGLDVLLFDWDLGYPWSKTEHGACGSEWPV